MLCGYRVCANSLDAERLTERENHRRKEELVFYRG